MQVQDIQTELVQAIGRLPLNLREQVAGRAVRDITESLIMEIGDAVRFASDAETAQRVQQHLFCTFLLSMDREQLTSR